MKKILLILLTFVSLNVFGQNDFFKVKDGSFREIEGFVMLDKNDHYDVNDRPMALTKISTENISAEERRKLTFKGNLETYFDVQLKPSEIYLYLSAKAATFIEIHHPDYGKTEFTLPYDLKDFCGYEMVLSYIPITTATQSVQQNNFLSIITDQDNAIVYIDDEYIGEKEVFKTFPIGTTHAWRIECDLYHTESGSVTITCDDNIIDKTLCPAHGFLNVTSSPENGALVFINNKKVGETPYKSDKLASGTYSVKVMKEMYMTAEQTFVVADGQTTEAKLDMVSKFVNVTINSGTDSDIYVDEEYKGKGSWNGKLSDGAHIVEARKESHETSRKEISLALGAAQTINIDAPKPIYGILEISSSPMRANIYIDGKLVGQTPKILTDVLVGTRELKLEKEGCMPITKNIAIKKGETLVLSEKMEEIIETVSATKNTPAENKYEDTEVYKVVEEMPQFPGGAGKMMEYIQQNTQYPIRANEIGIQGRVFVNFIIEPDGSISNVTVMRGIGGGCDEEAIRVVQSMPKWNPGKQRGKPVRCSYTLPVIFK